MIKKNLKRKNAAKNKVDLKTKKKMKSSIKNIEPERKEINIDDELSIDTEEADSVDEEGMQKGKNRGNIMNGGRGGSLNHNDQEEDKEDDVHGNDNDKDEDENAETVDEKRIRLAKQMLNQLKEARERKKEDDEDDFFATDGVYRDENDQDLINKVLQKDYKKKSQLVFNNVADKLKAKYDDQDGKLEIISLKGHTKCITCLEFDSNNQYLYSASKDGSLIKWDLTTGKKAVLQLGSSKDMTIRQCNKELLCMSINFDDRLLITGGLDKTIKLWDARDLKLIETFSSHKDSVHAVKFQNFSNQFCSTGADRMFKLWDAGEQALIDTFFGHKAIVNTMDCIGDTNMITGSYDKQVIYWKVEEESQLVFKSSEYSIDCIKSINSKYFVTGNENGSLDFWTINKKKPLFEIQKAHGENWLTALGGVYNSDIIFSGAYNNTIGAYKVDLEESELKKLYELPSNGVINDIKATSDCKLLAVSEGDEHRLGRWITSKSKNRIKLYKMA